VVILDRPQDFGIGVNSALELLFSLSCLARPVTVGEDARLEETLYVAVLQDKLFMMIQPVYMLYQGPTYSRCAVHKW